MTSALNIRLNKRQFSIEVIFDLLTMDVRFTHYRIKDDGIVCLTLEIQHAFE